MSIPNPNSPRITGAWLWLTQCAAWPIVHVVRRLGLDGTGSWRSGIWKRGQPPMGSVSEAWHREQSRLESRIEYHGPPWAWPLASTTPSKSTHDSSPGCVVSERSIARTHTPGAVSVGGQ